MTNKRINAIKETDDTLDIDPNNDYEGLDIEDDMFYQYNTKMSYGGHSLSVVDVEDYDFDNYAYND